MNRYLPEMHDPVKDTIAFASIVMTRKQKIITKKNIRGFKWD